MTIARLLLLLTLALPIRAEPVRYTLTNPTPRDYDHELVRLPVSPPVPFDSTRLTVAEDGKSVPHQVEVLQGSSRNVLAGTIWVRTSLSKGGSRNFTVSPETDPPKFDALVSVTESKDGYVLSNGRVEVKLPPATNGPDRPPGPITALRLANQDWVASSEWRSSVRCLMLQPRIVSRGPLFAQVELLYFFADPSYEGRVPFAAVTVRLNAGESLVRIIESHDMYQGDHWLLDLSRNTSALRPLILRDNQKPQPAAWPVHHTDRPLAVLNPDDEADPAMALIGVTGDRRTLAAGASLPAWDHPTDNAILLKPHRTPNAALLDLPTWRGTRNWLLILTPAGDLPAIDRVRRAATIDSLDHAIHPKKQAKD